MTRRLSASLFSRSRMYKFPHVWSKIYGQSWTKFVELSQTSSVRNSVKSEWIAGIQSGTYMELNIWDENIPFFYSSVFSNRARTMCDRSFLNPISWRASRGRHDPVDPVKYPIEKNSALHRWKLQVSLSTRRRLNSLLLCKPKLLHRRRGLHLHDVFCARPGDFFSNVSILMGWSGIVIVVITRCGDYSCRRYYCMYI